MSSLPRPDVSLAAVDVAILAGGLGTRLRGAIGETPKVLAPIGDETFLDYLLRWLAGFGARRIVMCLGFKADKVVEHLRRHPVPDLDVSTSIEPKPLGTAGALRLAVPLFRSDPVMVINGDTFIDADLPGFLSTHRAARSAASILSTAVPSMARYGRLVVDAAGAIQRFAEKDPTDTGPGPINAGIYLFSRSWLETLAQGQSESLERDVFAASAPGTFRSVPAGEAAFIDIGTPESLAEAGTVLARAIGRSRNPARDVA